LKQKSLLKKKRRAKSKIKQLDEMADELESKGIAVNRESLATRAKSRRTIASLEEAQDKNAKKALGLESDDESDDDDRELNKDKNLKKKE
jgi:hypothetical protein